MTTANNSGNNGNTIFIGGTGGGGGGNITYVPTQNPQWVTVTIPSGSGQQYTISGIDFAVPVDEKKKKSDGCSCKKCKEYFEFAEPNQEDGTLICWACRHGY